jgi:hypothetical protein
MKNPKSKIIAGVISIIVISLFFIIGPAQAFILGFSISDPHPHLGDSTMFTVSAEIEPGEILDIEYFTLELDGSKDLTCVFDTDGNIILGCAGMQIQKLQDSPVQPGYGFLPGILEYKITLDTRVLKPGDFEVTLLAQIGDQEIETDSQQFSILFGGDVNICSIRARNGETFFGTDYELNHTEQDYFSNINEASLYVPLPWASPGQGSLTAQANRKRISYSFEINNAEFIDSHLIQFDVTGSLRHPDRTTSKENAIITYNKDTETLTIDSGMFSAEDMDVTFVEGCN